MNKTTLKGKWAEIKGKVKEEWGDLTDDDLTEVEGKRDQLLAKVQQRYGKTREQAEKEIEAWERKHDHQ